jgi:hypothetical protein
MTTAGPVTKVGLSILDELEEVERRGDTAEFFTLRYQDVMNAV